VHAPGLPSIPISLGSVALTIVAIVITVFALIRSLQRGRIMWFLAILVTGPLGAVAYWLVSSFSDVSGPGRSVSSWPPRRRPR